MKDLMIIRHGYPRMTPVFAEKAQSEFQRVDRSKLDIRKYRMRVMIALKFNRWKGSTNEKFGFCYRQRSYSRKPTRIIGCCRVLMFQKTSYSSDAMQASTIE